MNTEFLVTTVVTISLAFAGYIITYFINIRLEQRKARLERVNRQLKDLYGPLFALRQASSRAWASFNSILNAKYPTGSKAVFVDNEESHPDKMKLWVRWMETVFMPLNEKIYELIETNSDLLIEEEMPQCILDFLAHVAAYKVVKRQWMEGDYSEYTSVINYPREIDNYAIQSYEKLKKEQTKLLGRRLK